MWARPVDMDDDGGVGVGSVGSVPVEGDASGGEVSSVVAAAMATPAADVSEYVSSL